MTFCCVFHIFRDLFMQFRLSRCLPGYYRLPLFPPLISIYSSSLVLFKISYRILPSYFSPSHSTTFSPHPFSILLFAFHSNVQIRTSATFHYLIWPVLWLLLIIFLFIFMFLKFCGIVYGVSFPPPQPIFFHAHHLRNSYTRS